MNRHCLEGAWYTTTSPQPMSHAMWLTLAGGVLTHCCAAARVVELRPRIPSDLVCPDCWIENTRPVVTP